MVSLLMTSHSRSRTPPTDISKPPTPPMGILKPPTPPTVTSKPPTPPTGTLKPSSSPAGTSKPLTPPIGSSKPPTPPTGTLKPSSSPKESQPTFINTRKRAWGANVNTPPSKRSVGNKTLPTQLQQVLPLGYSYLISEFEVLPNEKFCGAPESSFSTRLYVNVSNEADAQKWLNDLQTQTRTTYRVTRGSRVKGSVLVYKTERHCQHFRKYINPRKP